MEDTKNSCILKKNNDLLEPLSLARITRVHITLLKLSGMLAFGKGDLYLIAKNFLCVFKCNKHVRLFAISMYACHIVCSIILKNCEIGTVAEFVGLCGAHLRFLILYVKRAKLISLLDFCENYWVHLDNSERSIVRNFVKKSTNLSVLYLVSSISLCLIYLMVSQLPNRSLQLINETQIHRSLPYAFFVDVQSSPWYEFSVAMQMITMTHLCITCAGSDTAAPFLIMISCGYFKLLSFKIKRLNTLGDSNIKQNQTWSLQKQIIDCIIFHQKIIKFCKKVQDLTSLIFMAQLFSTTYNISLIGLQLVGDEVGKIKYFPVLTLLLTQLFLCHWAPNMLVSQSEYLAESTYFMPLSGYADKSASRIIHIVMVRSQRLMRLAAGGFVNLSLECFGSMVTSAVSFFTVLRSIN